MYEWERKRFTRLSITRDFVVSVWVGVVPLPRGARERLRHSIMALPVLSTYEPRCKKTGLRGFRPGPTQNQAVQPQKIA